MSDSEGRIIPIVEDDQGEGFKDPIDDLSELINTEYGEALKRTDKAWQKAYLGKLLNN